MTVTSYNSVKKNKNKHNKISPVTTEHGTVLYNLYRYSVRTVLRL